MSTKSSLAWGDDFHLYEEIFEEGVVHLELRGVDFQANRDAVEVAIPIAIWESIRQVGVATFELADRTDVELEAMAQAEVAARAARREEDRRAGREFRFLDLHDNAHGPSSDPEADRVARVVAYLAKARADQRALREKIASYRRWGDGKAGS